MGVDLNVAKKLCTNCKKVSVKAVTEALNFIKTIKDARPSGITSELV